MSMIPFVPHNGSLDQHIQFTTMFRSKRS